MRVQNDPHFLLYGYTKRMPYDVPNSTLIKGRASAREMDEVTEEIYHRIKRIRELSQELLEKEVKKYTRNQDKKDKDRKIEIGNLFAYKQRNHPIYLQNSIDNGEALSEWKVLLEN